MTKGIPDWPSARNSGRRSRNRFENSGGSVLSLRFTPGRVCGGLRLLGLRDAVLIVFAETGLVVTPFLPGDSLLFAAGALRAAGGLDPAGLSLLLVVAAVLGDAVNYSVGRFVGPHVFAASDHRGFLHRLLNRDHLTRAHEFFERYGGKAVVLRRFVPIVRTFVPFVAGAAAMTYPRFALYNVVGAILWVGVCMGAGFAFGNVLTVKNNFSLVALGIVIVSLLPMAVEFLRHRNDVMLLARSTQRSRRSHPHPHDCDSDPLRRACHRGAEHGSTSRGALVGRWYNGPRLRHSKIGIRRTLMRRAVDQ